MAGIWRGYGHMKELRHVTMSDIAGRVGVSKNAVSLALAGRPGVSEATRARVVAAARELGYPLDEKNRYDKACIAAIVPEYLLGDGSFYSDIFWSIEQEVRLIGAMMLTIGLSKAQEEKLVPPTLPANAHLIGYLPIGVIAPAYLRMLRDTGHSIVTVDIRSASPSLSCVGTDNVDGARQAVEYLISCGHRRIGFIGPAFSAQSVCERWCGYCGTMLKHGLRCDGDVCILGRRDGFELLDTEEAQLKYFGRIETMPTAWFCAGDLIALSLCKLLARRGLRVPQDVSVIGFDDLRISALVDPALTTMRVDRRLMGREAVRLLLRSYEEKDAPARHLALPCELVRRDSVRALGDEGPAL